MHKGSPFFTSLPSTVISCLFDHNHSDKCEMISLWFSFVFPWWLVMLRIFSCACWPSVYLLWRNVYPEPLNIFNWIKKILSCVTSLYNLGISPLSDILFANIFSHSVGDLFISLMIFFAVQKLFLLMWSHLFIFALVALARWQIQKSIAKTSIKELTAYVFF